MNDKIIDKLKKLLALAGNNPSQHEAQAAMEKAQEVALEHGIDLAMIDSSEQESDEVVIEYMEMGQRLPTVSMYVVSILKQFFDVNIITSGGRHSGRKLVFVGKTSSIANAKYIYTWLGDTMVRCWKKYYESTPHEVLGNKQNYLFGFYNGLTTKLEENKQKVEANKLTTEEAKNKYAVACITNQSKIDDVMKQYFPNVRTVYKKVSGSYSSYEKGMTDGKNCNIAKGGLDNASVAGVLA